MRRPHRTWLCDCGDTNLYISHLLARISFDGEQISLLKFGK
jgi:hypothetical protein